MSAPGAATRVVAFSGGVGGAKLVAGLAQIITDDSLAVIVNTGDDFQHLGLSISPDIDSVVYALAGKNDVARGWGRRDESWRFMQALAEVGAPTWFQLGDLDLAMHVWRTARLNQGAALSEVTAEIAARFGIRAQILPMSDDPVRTQVHTTQGTLEFQEYFVKLRSEPRVTGFEFSGSAAAAPPPAARSLLDESAPSAVIVCPSNPFVSIGPILAVTAWSDWLRRCRSPVIAVSPFVGRQALKGPAEKMMRELGYEPSSMGLQTVYGRAFDAWVIDRADAKDADALEALGVPCLVTDTVMRTTDDQTKLARAVLDFSARVVASARRAG